MRKTPLNNWEVGMGNVMLNELERMVEVIPYSNLSAKDLGELVAHMDDIQEKIAKHIVQHKQIEVVEQYLRFDEIIKKVRDLQTKRDVASM